MSKSIMDNKKAVYSLFLLACLAILLYNAFVTKSRNGVIYAVFMPLFLGLMPLCYKIFHLQPVQRLTSDVLLFSFFAYGIGIALYKFQEWDPVYDKIVHFGSGYLFAMIGLCAYYYLKVDKVIEYEKDAPIATAFSVTFAVTIGVIWEIMEFVLNFFVHSDPQRVATTGVTDTMLDLIADTLGALVAAYFIWRYLKHRKESGWMIRTFEDFAEKNILHHT